MTATVKESPHRCYTGDDAMFVPRLPVPLPRGNRTHPPTQALVGATPASPSVVVRKSRATQASPLQTSYVATGERESRTILTAPSLPPPPPDSTAHYPPPP